VVASEKFKTRVVLIQVLAYPDMQKTELNIAGLSLKDGQKSSNFFFLLRQVVLKREEFIRGVAAQRNREGREMAV
jgi:hypothetical protein